MADGHPLSDAAVNAARLVTFGEGAIVSRVLSKTASGTLTAFAFDGGQAISEHTTSHEAFALGLEGTFEFTVGGAVHLLTEGDLLKLPAGVPHGLCAKSRAKMLLVMFKV